MVHLGAGGFAFLLKYLTFVQASACAVGAIAFNALLLPRLGRGWLFREEERATPWRSGILLYPISVLLLILLFGGVESGMEVAATGWIIMAVGDAAATAWGRRFGRRPVPWNRTKTLEGSLACAFAATGAAWLMLIWMGHEPARGALLAVPTGVFAAFVESLPWRINDNLSVPLLSALFLRGLLEVDGAVLGASAPALRGAFLAGVLVNLLLVAGARRAGAVDRSGMLAGFLIGLLTYTFSGWPGYIVLIAFFILGSATTRVGYARKRKAGIAQSKKGARSARHALANCGVGAYLAILIAGSVRPQIFILAYVCAYAAAAFDTVSSEIGQAYGGRPVLITTLRRVAVGTDGAVSYLGTAAGGIAALLIGLVAAAAGLLPIGSLWIVVVAGFAGSTADSILGATLEARGLMDNEAVNFSNTVIGALVGLAMAALSAAPI
jgi:uncharacterized protein (TIGR00297 family)